MHLFVADHPLIDHKLTVLRDKKTPSPTFRLLVDELMTLLAYEATRHVAVEPVQIETPVASSFPPLSLWWCRFCARAWGCLKA